MPDFTREQIITILRNNEGNRLTRGKPIEVFWAADLSGLILSDIDFTNCMLWAADLRGTDLRCATFFMSALMGADLRGANLQEANLNYVPLTDSDLRNANLRDTNMQNCNLEGADLRGANLQGANVQGVTVDANTKLPEDTNFLNAMSTREESGNLLGPRSFGGVGKVSYRRDDFGRPIGGSGCGSIVAATLMLPLIVVTLLALMAFH